MPFLVDGNNVMGQSPGWHRDRQGARRRLLVEVAEFVAATRARVTVVFDGAPDEDFPDGSAYRGVRVYYPPRGVDADTLIERLLSRTIDRRGVTVVTSDRRLALECKTAGAGVLRSGEFRKKMAETARTRARDEEETAEHEPESGSVEDWLRYFGYDAE